MTISITVTYRERCNSPRRRDDTGTCEVHPNCNLDNSQGQTSRRISHVKLSGKFRDMTLRSKQERSNLKVRL